MHVETAMFLGWLALPVIGYAVGRLVLLRTVRSRSRRSMPGGEQRLTQLRRLRDEGHMARRGRMADAVRPAQDPSATAPPRTRQP